MRRLPPKERIARGVVFFVARNGSARLRVRPALAGTDIVCFARPPRLPPAPGPAPTP